MKNRIKLIVSILIIFFVIIFQSCQKEEIKNIIKVTTGEISGVTTKNATIKGVIVDIGEGVNEYGHVWSDSREINIDNPYTINHGERVNPGTYESEFTDLSPNTTYYVWAYASDGEIAVTGTMLSFTTEALTLATVITGAVNEISPTSVQITGILSNFGNGIDSTLQHGHCWSTSQEPTISSNKTELGSISTTGEFSSELTNLERGIIYYVRAYANTSTGISYGNEIHFTKSTKAPSIETIDVSLITETSAKSGGNITYDGEYVIITRGVCWNTSLNPTILDSYTSDSSGTGIFPSSITGLVRGTTYYIRAYVTNSICTAYGNEISFKTLDIPTVNTNPVSNVISTTAETGGIVADNGGTVVTTRGVCWSTSSNPTIADEHTTNGMGTGYYTSFITGLSPGITYYVRAYATNSVGIAYGNEVNFNTVSLNWNRSFGGSGLDAGNSIIHASDGGYIVAGSTGSNDGDVYDNHGRTDYLITKLNNNGDPEWQRCYGGSQEDEANSIIKTYDNGYVVAGYSGSDDGDVSGNQGSYDYWIVKFDEWGNMEWQKSLGGSDNDIAYSIVQTTDAGYVVAGRTYSGDGDVSGNHGGEDIWIVKLDRYGNLEWQKCFGGSSNERANSIIQTSDGGYAIAGYSNSNDSDVSGNHGDYDYWILKLDNGGNLEWQKCYGGSNMEKARSIIQSYDGGYAIAGYANSNDGDVSGNHGYSDYWILKLSNIGDLEWQKCFGGSYPDEANSIIQLSNGEYSVAGVTYSANGDVSGNHGNGDYWILKLDQTGELELQKCFGGSNLDYGKSIIRSIDGRYTVTGYSSSSDGDVTGNHGETDIWVIEFF